MARVNQGVPTCRLGQAGDRKPAFVVSLVGLGISSFLAYAYLWAGEVACPVGGAGRDVVRLSEYRSVLGIPVPLMGIGFSPSHWPSLKLRVRNYPAHYA
ncbi:MAG: hypothetical protein NTX54_10915 [Chloroflexi bacterium]|nr:hypothetical protein [Chloroflexota bacterium]